MDGGAKYCWSVLQYMHTQVGELPTMIIQRLIELGLGHY